MAGLRLATLLKKRLWHRRFPRNFVKFLKTSFSKEHLLWLVLPFQALMMKLFKKIVYGSKRSNTCLLLVYSHLLQALVKLCFISAKDSKLVMKIANLWIVHKMRNSYTRATNFWCRKTLDSSHRFAIC